MHLAADYAEVSALVPWFFPLVVFMIGACVGSFLNVVIYRLPKDESIVTPGSHCGCGQPIKWYDNIPMLSWLLLRGRARCCGRPFSFRYPFVELLTAGLFLACWLRFPGNPKAAVCGWIFVSCLVAATFIDLDHFIIPDEFTVALGFLGVVLSALVPALHGFRASVGVVNGLHAAVASIQGLLVGAGLVAWIALTAEAVLKKEAMGLGDVKFAGAIGAFCGWQGAFFAMFGGACVGTIWVGVAWLWQKMSGQKSPVALPSETPEGEETELAFGAHVPFGPMLAIAGVAYFLFLRAPVNAWFADLATLF